MGPEPPGELVSPAMESKTLSGYGREHPLQVSHRLCTGQFLERHGVAEYEGTESKLYVHEFIQLGKEGWA